MEIEGAKNGDIILAWRTKGRVPCAILCIGEGARQKYYFFTKFSGRKEFDSEMGLTPCSFDYEHYKIVGNIHKSLWRVERMLQEAYADE